MVEINYWADGTWCYASEIGEYGWMSDDYTTIRLLDSCCNEEIQEIIDFRNK